MTTPTAPCPFCLDGYVEGWTCDLRISTFKCEHCRGGAEIVPDADMVATLHRAIANEVECVDNSFDNIEWIEAAGALAGIVPQYRDSIASSHRYLTRLVETVVALETT